MSRILGRIDTPLGDMFPTVAGYRLSDDDLGRRLSAGRGYMRESVTQFAKRVTAELQEAAPEGEQPKINRSRVMSWEKGKFGSDNRPDNTRKNREDAIRIVEKATGLPPQFFSIDLQRLPKLVNAERLNQVMTPNERETFEARALEQELADASPRSPTSAGRSEESKPESETQQGDRPQPPGGSRPSAARP